MGPKSRILGNLKSGHFRISRENPILWTWNRPILKNLIFKNRARSTDSWKWAPIFKRDRTLWKMVFVCVTWSGFWLCPGYLWLLILVAVEQIDDRITRRLVAQRVAPAVRVILSQTPSSRWWRLLVETMAYWQQVSLSLPRCSYLFVLHQIRRRRRAARSLTSQGRAEPLCARITGLNREVSEGKADLWPRSFFFLRGPQGAANGQDSWGFFKNAQGFGRLDAGSRAGFTSSRPPPPWTSVFQFSLFLYKMCGLEKLGLVDQNWLERNFSGFLLRTLVVGRRQHSESIEIALDME